jgi:sulfur carrier protein ThiS
MRITHIRSEHQAEHLHDIYQTVAGVLESVDTEDSNVAVAVQVGDQCRTCFAEAILRVIAVLPHTGNMDGAVALAHAWHLEDVDAVRSYPDAAAIHPS